MTTRTRRYLAAPSRLEGAIGIGLVCLALLPLLFGISNYVLGLLISALVLSGLSISWALLGNLGGMVSFGHAAFFGVGAYASALLAARAGVPVVLSVPLGGCIAAISAVTMLPALRLSGPYFALAILAYSEIFRILATEASGITGGTAGLQRFPGLPTIFGIDFATRGGCYGLMVVMVALVAFLYIGIRKSHVGMALKAIGGSEDATRVVGVDSLRLKLAMLLVSAFIAGVFGALNAHVIGFLEPDYAFNGMWSEMPIIASVFGGYRSVVGPALGAIVIYLFDQMIAKSLIPIGHQILLGALLGGMVLVASNGMAGLAARITRALRPATSNGGDNARA